MPRGHAGLESPSSGGTQAVVLRVAVVFRETPLGDHELLPLQAVQRGVECAFTELQGRAGRLADPVRDRVSVARSPTQRFENEEVERATREIDIEIVHGNRREEVLLGYHRSHRHARGTTGGGAWRRGLANAAGAAPWFADRTPGLMRRLARCP